jgi:hypothetical protein
MLTSPPQQCVRYLIARSPSAGKFREHFDCPIFIWPSEFGGGPISVTHLGSFHLSQALTLCHLNASLIPLAKSSGSQPDTSIFSWECKHFYHMDLVKMYMPVCIVFYEDLLVVSVNLLS